MLRYQTVPVTAFQQNCSIVWCDRTMDAAIIDPGGDLDRLLNAVKQLGVNLCQIWITHGHIDHAGATAELAERLQLPIIGPHEGDQFWIDGLPEERDWMTRLLDEGGLVDVYRRLQPDTTDACYTWWSNRGQAYANNVGWRLDYHLATPALAALARSEEIYKDEKFSDHAPITIGYEIAL